MTTQLLLLILLQCCCLSSMSSSMGRSVYKNGFANFISLFNPFEGFKNFTEGFTQNFTKNKTTIRKMPKPIIY